ncbi:bi-domain-containing oxidoreductase [Magnetococcales bacterium HHB-1]
MKQILVRQGQAFVEQTPAPIVEAGYVRVLVDHSCISIGTEMSGVRSSGDPLWKKALRNPDLVRKVAQMALSDGLGRTRRVVQGKMAASGNPSGYSAAGTVLEVGSGIEDLKPGDRVACAGAQCAHHAEVITVPRNLTVAIPEKLSFAEASTVTLGAIALQGLRRAKPTLGETFVVVGLGILGQLTVQFLKANGCRVIGTDLEPGRIETALQSGMDLALEQSSDGIKQVLRLTDGIGADGVIVTAASSSNEIMSTAFKMCRKKGRVVLVGAVGLDLNRGDFYQKELDFFISTSYGPGRYDRNYEEEGLDYPISYVRWTENRNMVEYLRLLEEQRIDIKPLIAKVYPIDEATAAYDTLKNESPAPLMVLLNYPQRAQEEMTSVIIQNPLAEAVGEEKIRIAIIGAGGFAKGMHIPNLQSMVDRYHIQAIVSRSGHNAQTTAKQCGANYATTDYQKVVQDDNVDAVLICTRHNLHATMASDALKAGKHVLLEKPMALTREEMALIQDCYKEEQKGPVLLTGFNRRFSPHAEHVQKLIQKRSNPMILNYRMNAGHIPLDHWVHTEEGGGRNRGEGCHIYDLFTYFTQARAESVGAFSLKPKTDFYSSRDNFVATIRFEDGSVATLTYTALGSNAYPKEHLEIFVDGQVIQLTDYQEVALFGSDKEGMKTSTIQKGQKEELEYFAQVIQKGGAWPIPFWQQLQATEIAIEVDHLLGK